MQISARFAAIASMVFASVCLWFALDGFTSPADDADSISGGRSFAWFWAFLGAAGLAVAWLTWRFGREPEEDRDA